MYHEPLNPPKNLSMHFDVNKKEFVLIWSKPEDRRRVKEDLVREYMVFIVSSEDGHKVLIPILDTTDFTCKISLNEFLEKWKIDLSKLHKKVIYQVAVKAVPKDFMKFDISKPAIITFGLTSKEYYAIMDQ
ncbi:hypothetical protein CL617_05430 [archaeon]|nr:hypothetical protein [archaeon]|tara:strand:+ start:4723 stop:5115 length:393 start_codon:yes stop_codon:yes gene_type:complete